MVGTMEPFVPSTPSPGPTARIHTPPAPQHGYSDNYQPYTPGPRKSTRIAQRAANRTPSPQPSSRRHQQESSLGSPKSTNKHFASNMATPALSPQKKRMPPMDSSRRVSGTLTAEGTATAAVALGLSPAPMPESRSRRTSAMTGAGNLVTPAKTPSKPPNDKVKDKVKAVARNLFHSDDEERPSSFYSVEVAEASFEIYTDSNARVPEKDTSAENPFYVGEHTAVPEPPRRRSKRNTVTIPGEGRVSIEEAVRREDGMLITFRGKKQFRKFSELEESLDDGEGGLESAVEAPRRHFTRSSIKPRLLFPTAMADEAKLENADEEAPTDIEDHVLAGLEAEKPETPVDLIEEAAGTPKAPRHAPASPPATARTTRFGSKKATESSPMKAKPAKGSPFDSWRRTKAGAQSTGHKRSGEDIPAAASKRTRA
ncbi:uncharacterized protein B0T15DRAFT_271123 [Chaetomium strumarium]|uniref:Uncharacterized protein n=1 Tax=Chaetomium strumarium TaxID=1170767 RepID=A0AAJ0GNR3_9PEZI|nr:hypothetical protein B0T15DRAFT_271123 [Chaetomium strumarium]